MAFIDKTDLLRYIRLSELDDITQSTDAALDAPIADATDYISDMISHRYIVATIFASVDKTEFRSLRVICIHITLYYLYNLITPDNIPEKAVVNFDVARDDLKAIRDGKTGDAIYPHITPDSSRSGIVKTSSTDIINTSW